MREGRRFVSRGRCGDIREGGRNECRKLRRMWRGRSRDRLLERLGKRGWKRG
jgi:hypothetical protein